ncbi:CCA tRNA nucleotidyltransferase [Thermaurantiacus tibetensis]|uniref:CCA tRNA nucleotidyltransferase n=1 Tax=Thermaurantiacus tibetensis TaxID=2759035 RepID=UPI00188F1E40|nr:CCA tRNA nucleotidyltransferase [Thermaurantiacus tibetensis]
MTRVDPALWLARPRMERLLGALAAAEGATRVVGGAVRDALLGLPVADIDFATRLVPDEVMARLAEAGLKAVPTGLSHGTVTAVAGGIGYQVTTLRRDVGTDGRHARVVFTRAWEEDAARRDFTINALYADPLSGEVTDFFGGTGDLAARRVRFIGDPLLRIAEDHLRILRFFRFSARYADRLDPEGLAACAARANDLKALSRERVRDELLKLLEAPDPAPTVEAMVAHGVMAAFLPEAADVARLRALLAAERRAGARPAALRRLAALLPETPALAAEVAARLRLSNAEKARLVALTTPGAVPEDPRALAYRAGGAVAADRMLLLGDARAARWLEPLAAWERPSLPLTGKDLIALGLPPGPEVSRTLAEVERDWIAAGFPEDREAVLALARHRLEQG